MAPKLSHRDLKLLSAYLDDQLTDRQKKSLVTRLGQEPALQTELDNLQATKNLLASLPQVNPPRDYTLDPRTVPVRTKNTGPFVVMRLTASIATILFVMVTAGDLLTFNQSGGSLETAVSAPEALKIQAPSLADNDVGDQIESGNEVAENMSRSTESESAQPETESFAAEATPSASTGAAADQAQAPEAASGDSADSGDGAGETLEDDAASDTASADDIPQPEELQVTVTTLDIPQEEEPQVTEAAVPTLVALVPPEPDKDPELDLEIQRLVEDTSTSPPTIFSSLRNIEIILALIAVFSGGLAFFFNRD